MFNKIITKIFNKKYDNFGETFIYRVLNIGKYSLKLIHHKTFEQEEFPSCSFKNEMLYVCKGSFVCEHYLIKNYLPVEHCSCLIPEQCSQKPYYIETIKRGNIIFNSSHEVQRKIEITPNTWILSLQWNEKCSNLYHYLTHRKYFSLIQENKL